MSRIIELPFAEACEFNDPVNTAISHYSLTVKASNIHDGFPLSVNPRDQKIAGIYKDVSNSLLNNDGLFLHKNMGITILARSVGIDPEKKVAKINCGGAGTDLKDKKEIYGVINGGHTYRIILNANTKNEANNKDTADISQQFVKINIITGIDDKAIIQQIARAHNTSKSVKEMSLADFMDEFDWMKNSLGSDLSDRIVWHENDPGVIDVIEVICLLHCLHPELYSHPTHKIEKQPTIAYSQKAAALKMYLQDSNSFKKFRTILPDILELKDFIQANAWDQYNQVNRGLGTKVFEKPKKGQEFLIYEDMAMSKKILLRAAYLPIFASSRVLIRKGATYGWQFSKFDDVKSFLRDSLAEYIHFIIQDIGQRNPSAWGKDFSLWTSLADKSELKYIKQANP